LNSVIVNVVNINLQVIAVYLLPVQYVTDLFLYNLLLRDYMHTSTKTYHQVSQKN
jgi:hypothetical protein